MANQWCNLMLLASLAVGYTSAIVRANESAAPLGTTAPVDYEISSASDDLTPSVAQPDSVVEHVTTPETVESLPLQAAAGLSLSVVEELALANNPTIAQMRARICALKGKWLQVGLPPNPTVGYMGSEIGAGGTAGQQGGFAGQQIVTAGKLKRNRAVVCAEIKATEQQLAIVLRRVQTDVRLQYYAALLAQRRVELAKELVHIAAQAAATSQSLIEAEEIPLAGLSCRLKSNWRTRSSYFAPARTALIRRGVNCKH